MQKNKKAIERSQRSKIQIKQNHKFHTNCSSFYNKMEKITRKLTLRRWRSDLKWERWSWRDSNPCLQVLQVHIVAVSFPLSSTPNASSTHPSAGASAPRSGDGGRGAREMLDGISRGRRSREQSKNPAGRSKMD